MRSYIIIQLLPDWRLPYRGHGLALGRLFVMALLLGAVAFLGSGNVQADQVDEANIPERIAGMERVRVVSGMEAARIIDRMHQGNVATQANFIAHYEGGGHSADYYLSLYETPEQAVKGMEDMAEVMAREGHGFSHLMKRDKDGLPFYMALGQGQAHYFFARGLELVWLAVDMKVAEKALMDVL
ncbi:hypothetical protein SAMN05660653_02531 [Desulfonatronum thiosulfatophilum]|uniref:Uncharacterized protein n=1 Tax=Desulfonatronum thiosulfatophilum TaxID=617002 RepID=A0A1G6E1Q8_9BACT|nr:hypothetical protein [Desulfonatronum thiosulfatophilum]SDB51333.1 hypothetical protein SAMN05660653_02531 [Desulfonatronum thiosulfatophilum]